MAYIENNYKDILSKEKYCVGNEVIIKEGVKYHYVGSDCDSKGRTVLIFNQISQIEKRFVLNDEETEVYVTSTIIKGE